MSASSLRVMQGFLFNSSRIFRVVFWVAGLECLLKIALKNVEYSKAGSFKPASMESSAGWLYRYAQLHALRLYNVFKGGKKRRFVIFLERRVEIFGREFHVF